MASNAKAGLRGRNLIRAVALIVAFLMIGAGALLSRSDHAAKRGAAAQSESQVAPAVSVAPSDPGPAQTDQVSGDARPGSPELPRAGANAPAEKTTEVVPHPDKPPPSAPKRPTRGSLPPFLPPLYGPGVTEEAEGPPPGVLWLSGVIQGEPRLALLRRGNNRYLVREGDTVEGKYRVGGISANSVVLLRGARRQTLRLGQY